VGTLQEEAQSMLDLVYELKRLAERNRDGSYATIANRKSMLMLMGKQLVELGYNQLHANELKGRHINKLLALWKTQSLSHATIRNRLSALRWVAEKIGRRGILPKTNRYYDLTPRQFVARVSKAQPLPENQLTQIKDRYVRMSLELQKAFGLRRAESILIRPWQADHSTTLVLQGSWTKGGRPREVPILIPGQREVLDRAKALVKLKHASLIPAHLLYKNQLAKYEYWCSRVGLSRMHGLRHAYAQARFLELAGFPAPAAGGPMRQDLTPEQREIDQEARMILSAELGHCREAITAAYLGR
jgi:site-specific recombinase XerC